MVAKSIAKIYTNIHKPTDYSAACLYRTLFTLVQGNSSTVRPLSLRPHTYQTERSLCGAGINSGRAIKSRALFV